MLSQVDEENISTFIRQALKIVDLLYLKVLLRKENRRDKTAPFNTLKWENYIARRSKALHKSKFTNFIKLIGSLGYNKWLQFYKLLKCDDDDAERQ